MGTDIHNGLFSGVAEMRYLVGESIDFFEWGLDILFVNNLALLCGNGGLNVFAGLWIFANEISFTSAQFVFVCAI